MIKIISAYDRVEDMLALIKEYTDDIGSHGDEIKECLSSQNLSEELADIRSKYALPYGRMYIALFDGKTVGSVALAKDDEEHCELKRLYVREEYRGMHIARALMDKVIEDAKTIGYRYMRLDTFPFMANAIKLYENYGFTYIDKYNDNPAGAALFMQLDLEKYK